MEGELPSSSKSAGKRPVHHQISTPSTKTTTIPTIGVQMIGAHPCCCEECQPRFIRETETKLIRKIYRENTAELAADTKDRISQEVIAKHGKDIEQQVLASLNASVPREASKRLAAYEAEMKAKSFEKITKEWEAKLTANYRAKVEAEVRNEMHGKLGIIAPATTTTAPATAPTTVPTATATSGKEKATDDGDPADTLEEEERLYYDKSEAF